ncbi:MAG: VWA domain-containing protein, partial [Candidatus Aminicenantales bacterium]
AALVSHYHSFRRKGVFIILGLFLAAAIPGGMASSSQDRRVTASQESHGVTVRRVLVDVIAVRKGEFVGDLVRDDFELFEDGTPVPVLSCELVSRDGIRVETEEGVEEQPLPPSSEKKLTVIFDNINNWGRKAKKDISPVAEELMALINAGDEVMVCRLTIASGLEAIQPFTTERGAIRKAVFQGAGEVWDSRSDLNPMFTINFDEYERRMLDVSSQTIYDYTLKAKYRYENALGGILSAMNSVRRLPGRKSILFVSSGLPDVVSMASFDKSFPADLLRIPVRIPDPSGVLKKKMYDHGDEALREIIAYANTHHVSIYSLDPDAFAKAVFAGTIEEYFTPDAMKHLEFREKEKLQGLQVMRELSEGTGAVALRGAKKYVEFRRIVQGDLSKYYVLSFAPIRKEPDGLFHKTSVKVKRKGLDLRFRKGYTDDPMDEVRDGRSPGI